MQALLNQFEAALHLSRNGYQITPRGLAGRRQAHPDSPKFHRVAGKPFYTEEELNRFLGVSENPEVGP